MEQFLIDTLAKAYSNCATKDEAVGVSHVVKSVIKKNKMTGQERGDFVHEIYSKLLKLGYNKEVFPVNEEEYYKSIEKDT